MGRVTLSGRGRRRLLGGHPWVYADDVAASEAAPGELVAVHGPDGSALGFGLWSSSSRIALRLVTRRSTAPDRGFWAERVEQALALRAAAGLLGPRDACRLLHGDADGFPGLVVDRYADALVLQSGCQGSDLLVETVLELLLERLPFPVEAVLERSDAAVRAHEALEPRVRWLRGERQEPFEAREAARAETPELVFEVSLTTGHKTGHYLDQRANRARAARDARGARVLDAFCYDGLFGIRAALGGAREVLLLDQSEDALERAARNAERNGVAGVVARRRANAMHALRDLAQTGERFDLVVLDPPAFAKKKGEVEGALRGYRELNRRALQLLEPGGVLVTCSCSHNVDRDAFRAALGAAAVAAGREARIVEFRGASEDHPVLATLPESEYLKCAVVRVGT
jgi:23S rRNA (cytosine1962-C5)-methyltransferase